MTPEEINKGVDNLIKYVYEKFSANSYVLISEYLESYFPAKLTGVYFFSIIRKRAEVNNLIDGDEKVIQLTEKGIEVVELGGWFKYLENEKNKKTQQDSILKIDSKLKRLQLNTFWIFFAMAIIGVVFSTITISNNIRITNENKVVQAQLSSLQSQIKELNKAIEYASQKNKVVLAPK